MAVRRTPVHSQPIQQAAFSGGEISPNLAARVDLARYQVALKQCRNFLVRQYGGIDNRPGTRFVAQTKDNAAVRLVPFKFNTEQSYVLECGPEYIRVVSGGAQVLDGGVPVEVVTPYLADELEAIRTTQSADVLTLVHPNHDPRNLKRLGPTSYTLTLFDAVNGPFDTLNTDEDVFVWADAELGDTTMHASSAVWLAGHVGSLFYVEPRELRAIKPWEAGERNVEIDALRRSDGKVYRCVSVPDIAIMDPVPDPPPDPLPEIVGDRWYQTGTVRPTHDKGRAFDGPQDIKTSGDDKYITGVEWRYEHGGFGIVKITGFTSPTEVSVEVMTKLPSDVVGGPDTPLEDDTLTGDGTAVLDISASVAGFSSLEPNDYRVVTNNVEESPEYEVVSVAPGPILTVSPVIPNLGSVIVRQIGGGDMSSAYSDVWAHGAWSEVNGYPAVVGYYSDRIVFANTPVQPQTVWMSKVGEYVNFGKSVPTVDDDAITATINARDVNEIRAIVPLDSMILLTASAEWRVTAGQDQVLTPSTIGFKPQSYRGASWAEPVVVGNSAVFVQDRGNTVRDLGYQFDVDGYTGSELSLFAHHLVERNEITQLAFAQVPYSLVLAIRDDGTLLAMTYVREQEVIAWSTLDTVDGVFEQVVTIPEAGEDAIYVVVAREVNGSTARYIERFETRLFEEISEALFMDSALSFDGTNLTATTVTVTTAAGYTVDDVVTITSSAAIFTGLNDVGDEIRLTSGGVEYRLRIEEFLSTTEVKARPARDLPAALQATATATWSFARDTFAGLDHLEGETVSVLADGMDVGDFTVLAGTVTLLEPAAKVSIGLPITSDIETLEINAERGTMRVREKLISRVTLVVGQSRNILAGPTFDKLDEWKPRDSEFYDDPPALLDGNAEINITGSWSQRGRVVVRQDRPLPLSIFSLIPEVAAGD